MSPKTQSILLWNMWKATPSVDASIISPNIQSTKENLYSKAFYEAWQKWPEETLFIEISNLITSFSAKNL